MVKKVVSVPPISPKGFTLLEVLLVIGLIAILASIVIVAINPARQLSQGRNTQRKVDVNTILNAVYQFSIDNRGNLPGYYSGNIPLTAVEICTTGGNCTGLVNLASLYLNETYLTAIPTDPSSSTANSTGYSIRKTSNNRVTVAAPYAELGDTISVTR